MKKPESESESESESWVSTFRRNFKLWLLRNMLYTAKFWRVYSHITMAHCNRHLTLKSWSYQQTTQAGDSVAGGKDSGISEGEAALGPANHVTVFSPTEVEEGSEDDEALGEALLTSCWESIPCNMRGEEQQSTKKCTWFIFSLWNEQIDKLQLNLPITG